MKKIMFNRPVKRGPWGGGSHFITAFHDYLIGKGYKVVFGLEESIDLIFMFDPRPSPGLDCANRIYQYKFRYPATKVIQRINDTDIARPLDKPWRVKTLLESNKIADHTVFISNWVKNHYIENGYNQKKSNTVIINGCNENWYFPEPDKKINKSKIRLITHHWSNNYMKGFDLYHYLDNMVNDHKNLSFTYMGRYNENDHNPKNTSIIEPKYGPEIGNILRNHDIYVTAARWEACGMHHIEGAACGLPVLYHADGGAIPEVCANHGIEFSSPDTFISALDNVVKNYNTIRGRIDYDYLSMTRCCHEYEEVIRQVL
jgi:glycosyltransferase involved in cell wall biosynthesis